MCYIPDPIEQLEAWEDRMAEKYGLPDGTFKCAGCGVNITVGKCRQVGAPPYGVPVCEKCFHEAYQDSD